jgi:hypothetical protein
VVKEVMALLATTSPDGQNGTVLEENARLRIEIAELNRDLAETQRKISALEKKVAKKGSRILLKDVPGADLSQPSSSRYNQAVRSACIRNKSWAIPPDEYAKLASMGCSYCGGPTGGGIGLDRLDNKKGYEVDNVTPCCPDCNMLRRNKLTPEQTEAAVAAIKAVEPKTTTGCGIH